MGKQPDLDLGDTLYDAARLHVAGETARAGLTAIPAINRDPVTAGAFLIAMVAHATREYARVTGMVPTHAFDCLWSKPERDGAS